MSGEATQRAQACDRESEQVSARYLTRDLEVSS